MMIKWRIFGRVSLKKTKPISIEPLEFTFDAGILI